MARVMPHNLEAEMSVLGVAFISKEQIDKICESVTEDMFFDEKNRCIFNAIKNLYNEHVPVDITTVKNELDKIEEAVEYATGSNGLEQMGLTREEIDKIINYYKKIGYNVMTKDKRRNSDAP